MKIAFYLLLVATAFSVVGCSSEETKKRKDISFLCDAEKTVGDSIIATNQFKVSGAPARSKDRARSGKYSLKLNDKFSYGYEFRIRNIKKGQIIEVNAWKNADAESGAIVITPEGLPKGSTEGYTSSGHIRELKGEWGKMSAMFVAQRDYDSVSCFVYNLSEKSVYVDDFSVQVYFDTKKPKPEAYSQTMRLDIPKQAQDSLDNFRNLALERKVITDDLKAYVRAYIHINGERAPIELRLKGDWTDHVESNKVSYRIKMCDGYAYKGLRTFSIQNPSTRSFLMEWFAHELYENEDILTTKYEMIPVVINGKNKGVYAMEEHFDKQLLEARKRREGPIMKFDESGVWQMHLDMMKENIYRAAPSFESAEITVFKKNRTKKNPVLFAQFREAQSKMEALRNRDADVANYFDVESLAKYLALTDLINGKHGLTWHNQRYYFNPVTQRLEPIAYDCFVEINLLLKQHELIGLMDPTSTNYAMVRSSLTNKQVQERYAHYLKKYSDPNYLKGIYKKLDAKIKAVEKLIQFEYPNIQLDKSFFEFNRQSIQSQLKTLNTTEITLAPWPSKYKPLPENFIFTDIALKANVELYHEDSSVQMSLQNFHSYPLEIIGYSTKENKQLIVPVTPITLEAYGKGGVVLADFPVKPRRIHYRAANCGAQIFKCNPEEWPRAVEKDNFTKGVVVQKVQTNDEVRLSGKIMLRQPLIIPACKRLVVEPGTEIELFNGAFLLTYAPIQAVGTDIQPIRVFSRDPNAQGLVCLSSQKSILKHVSFEGLGTIDYENWHLTGAVTFYGASVELQSCRFENNHCEDALNTIRCKVAMNNCKVNQTYSDGFDADFCSGVVKNSKFSNTGNDCIDFSGSVLTISNCTIVNSGDKGISGGEKSRLIVENCTINGAEIGVASKDKSKVTIRNINIVKANYAFAAYRKKPEYGPAKLLVESVKSNKAKQLYLLEKDSQLDYQGKHYVGDKKFDIDAMYAQFSK